VSDGDGLVTGGDGLVTVQVLENDEGDGLSSVLALSVYTGVCASP
jgi:hypothetical protein